MVVWTVYTLGQEDGVDIEGTTREELEKSFRENFPGSMSFGLLCVHPKQRDLYTLAYLKKEGINSRGLLEPSEIDFGGYCSISD